MSVIGSRSWLTMAWRPGRRWPLPCACSGVQQPRTLIAAAPVGSRYASDILRPVAEHLVCPLVPDDLMAVGAYYDDFGETSDSEVRMILAETIQKEMD